jgi:single-strand DNA-binding protein
MNRIVLMGRLTRDVESKMTASGIAVAKFSLAVQKRVKSGEHPQALFVDIECWQKTAEFVSKYFTKGMQVVVEGRLDEDRWEKDGVKHQRTKVVADNVYFAEGRRDGGGENHTGAASYPAPAVTTGGNVNVVSGDGFYTVNESDSDLPF